MADSFQDARELIFVHWLTSEKNAKELKMTLDEEKKDLLIKNGILREKEIQIIK